MSIIACDTPQSALDESAWRAVCKTAAEDANRRCGLSYEYYVELFSQEIDAQASRLPDEQRVLALEIASHEWGYETPHQRRETQDWDAANGFCEHGIELGCCPVGCDEDM